MMKIVFKLAIALVALISAVSTQFVRVDPKDTRFFQLNGKRFTFQGSNQREAGIYLKPHEIEHMMKENIAMNFKVIRIWAFNEDSCGLTGCFVYIGADKKPYINHEAMKRLDWVLFYAQKYGIKVIMVPVNYEPSFGGMEWWVHRVKGPQYPHHHFYIDPNVQGAYRTYLKALVDRVNHLTGVKFKDDPTIMAWDTANEPHTKDGVDPTGQIVAKWVCDMAYHLKFTLGVKQMVTSGEEGYQTNGYKGGANQGHEWVQNGLKGVDFRTNAACKYLDYSTVHLYPDNWKIPIDKFDAYINEFLYERTQITRANKKPLVVEEFGCCLDAQYKGKRYEIYQKYLQAFQRHAIAGQLVWQMFPAHSPLLRDHVNYDFTPATDRQSADLLIKEAKKH